MSIRLLVIVIITFCNSLIILFSVLTGIWFVSQNIKEAQEADMTVVADIADRYLSNEIELLHLKASEVAQYISAIREIHWAEIFPQWLERYPEFIGGAIYDRNGRIITAGEVPPPANALETTHIAAAFQGKKTMKTTYPSADSVVFYLSVPMPNELNYILAVTLPGTYFHKKLIEFIVWETGHIFVVDTEGTLVSNPRIHWVTERWNIPQMALEDPGFEALNYTTTKMRNGETGIGYYTVYGIDRVCAYRPISYSQDGWSLGAIAPLPESPFRFIYIGLIIAGSLGFILGIITAIIAANYIKKPFEKVEALKEESELNSKYKSQFLANMSHEMRTPLTSVLGLTELTLRTAYLDEDTRNNLVKVYRSGETLLGLINDILDISKIEAGKLTLNNSDYDLPSMLNDTITQSLLYIGEKDIELVLDINEDLPRRLYGDELRTKQIYNNLLSNAFKFTKEGKVVFKIRCQSLEDDYVWVVVQVSDTGVGIKQEDFDKLFTLYAKMESADKVYDNTRRTEGTGLGLSICKRIAEMMDGSITVESEYGKGSVFTVKVKQKINDATPIGEDVVKSLKKFRYTIDKLDSDDLNRLNLSYARVLVVDDNLANLDVAKGLMSLYEMTIDCVTGGLAAVSAIRDEKVRYNAIFMDHMMPEVDGIEAARMIREIGTEYATSIPIIALTANAIIGSEDFFLQKGFQAFVTKPIDLSHLDRVLRQWVRDKDLEQKTLDNSSKSRNESVERNIFTKDIQGMDIEKCISHFVKEDVLLNVLKSYAEHTRPLLEDIKYVTEENLEQYSVIVHGIKGSSRGIFAKEVGRLAEDLELASKAGDLGYVLKFNQIFIDSIMALVTSIEAVLEEIQRKKPIKEKIDKASLVKFKEACDNLDIDEMDICIKEIDEYRYNTDGELVHWLYEKLNQGKYKEIKEKLMEEINA